MGLWDEKTSTHACRCPIISYTELWLSSDLVYLRGGKTHRHLIPWWKRQLLLVGCRIINITWSQHLWKTWHSWGSTASARLLWHSTSNLRYSRLNWLCSQETVVFVLYESHWVILFRLALVAAVRSADCVWLWGVDVVVSVVCYIPILAPSTQQLICLLFRVRIDKVSHDSLSRWCSVVERGF